MDTKMPAKQSTTSLNPEDLSEIEFFKWMWAQWEEKQYVACAECFVEIKFHPAHCAHILGKGTCPEARLDPENLMPLCFKHHTQFDQGDRQGMLIFEITEKIRRYIRNKWRLKDVAEGTAL